MSLIILQVIPSLIGYIIIVLNFNYVTWSFPEYNFRQWAKPTSIFLVISVRLEQQAWFRVCVVPVVPITFLFIIPLTWWQRRPITSSRNLSPIVVIIINILKSSRISIDFMMRNTILAPRWFLYHRQHYCLPSGTNLFRLWSSLLSSLCYVLPWSITYFISRLL